MMVDRLQLIAMQLRPLSDPPKRFTHCLIRRDLDSYLEVNGQIQYGLKERRGEFLIGVYTGLHWLGREAHWTSWAEIPSESDKAWNSAKLFIPPSMKPVLVVLPQAVVLPTVVIPAGLGFAYYDEKTWRVHKRLKGARNDSKNQCWLDIGMKKISSWLELQPLNERLRSDF